MTKSCAVDPESSSSIKAMEFLGSASDYQLLKKDSVLWSYSSIVFHTHPTSLNYFNAYLHQNQGYTTDINIFHKIPVYKCDISLRFEVPTMVLLKIPFLCDFMLCP